jgi:hypothetical protein
MAKFDLKTFNPEAFGKYIDTIPKTRRNELIKSGALKPNSQIREAFSNQTGVMYATLPMYGVVGGAPQNYDGETDIVANSTTTYERSVIVTGRASAWMEKDFSEDITGGAGFMSNVARQIASYWEDVDQDTLISILNGIYMMAGAANAEFVSKHTYDITSKAGDAAMVEATTLNTALQQACGDNKKVFSIVCMHSVVATRLENLNLMERLKYTDAQGIQRELSLGTWNGKIVLIDDNMPTIEVPETSDGAGDGYTKYITYALGNGAFDFEDIGAEVPYEMDRDPAVNGGQNTLYSRQRKVLAPYGISFTKSSMASKSPTAAELANGANWTLVNDGSGKYIEHKAIPIARLISRG